MKLYDKCQEMLSCVDLSKVPAEVQDVIAAFGGVENILAFNNSISELRYDVKDLSKVNEEALRKLGACKVNFFDREKHVQVCFGDKIETLNILIKKYLPELKAQVSSCTSNATSTTSTPATQETHSKVQCAAELDIVAPVSGKISTLASLKDGVFSEGLVGNGVAITLDLNQKQATVLAPFDAKVTMLPANKNQLILSTPTKVELVLVIGQDSHKLNGIGFDAKVTLNSQVKQGQELLVLDLTKFKAEGIDNHVILSTTADSIYQSINHLAPEAKVGTSLFKLSK